ncbi:hypothetical protein [Lysinibacillus sp. fls2-241-R2A-57]|nr:hypothetical protein [Lysinibacillus sp. fls2-241-R2A-57]
MTFIHHFGSSIRRFSFSIRHFGSSIRHFDFYPLLRLFFPSL